MKIAIIFLSAAISAFSELTVPLQVDNWVDVSRIQEPVTAGVPLPEGAVNDLSRLRIVNASGNTVPAQFRALTRWWVEKNAKAVQNPSVKWVLCDFQATVSASGSGTFTLKDDNTGGLPQTALKVETSSSHIAVTTGPLKFSVSKTHFNLFDELWLDKNGDTQFDSTERLISSTQANGGFITAGDWAAGECVDGTIHASSLQAPDRIVIEEEGPMKVVLRVEGKHYAAANGVSRGLYGYQVFITAYTGQPYVDVQWGVTNYHIGMANGWLSEYYVWPFKQYDLVFNFNLGASQSYKLLGASSEISGNAASTPARLYQGRGKYTVTGAPDGTSSLGGVSLSDASTGIAIAVRDFAPRNPGALKVQQGKMTLELFPDTGATAGNHQYWLDSRTRKNTRMRIAFAPHAMRTNDLLNLAKAVNAPLRLLAPATWYQSTRAYYRGGFSIPFDERWKERMAPNAWVRFAKDSIASQEAIDHYNTRISDWRTFGSIPGFNSGSDHYGFTTAFWKYILTGNPQDFESNEASVFYFNDIVPVQAPVYEMWNKWAGAVNEDTIVKSSEWQGAPINFGFETLNRFPGATEWNRPDADCPDAGHMTQMELLEYYELTGDYATRDAMEGLALEAIRYLYSYTYHDGFGIWKVKNHHSPVPLDSAWLLLSSYGPRYIARPAIVCAHAYEMTGDERYLRPMAVGTYALRNGIRINPVGFCAIPGGSAFKYQSKSDSIWIDHHPGDTATPFSWATSFFQHSIGLEGLYAYWSLTGDREIRDALTLGGNFLKEYAGMTGSTYTGWSYVYYDYYEEGKRSDSTTAGGGPFLGFASSSYESVGGVSNAYLATGRQDFFKILQDAQPTCGFYGYYPERFDVKIHSLFEAYYKHDSLDAVPPATITNLSCDTLSGNGVTLSWTAPGDNGNSGLAAEYRIKFAPVPMVEIPSRWDSVAKTGWPDLTGPTPYTLDALIARSINFTQTQAVSFWAAQALPQALVPHAAGSQEILNIGEPLLPNTPYYFALAAYDKAGNVSGISNVVRCTTPAVVSKESENSKLLPFAFYGSRPNPFNPMTVISYYAGQKATAALKIYNTQGRLVRTLFSGTAPKGLHQVMWDGKDNQGRAVSSGLYLSRITCMGQVREARMVLVR